MFTKALQETIDHLRSTEEFNTEADQLHRFIFMNCKQFRMMQGLHEMKKAHQALLRYLNLDVATAVESLKGSICDSSSKRVSLPYRQNLDYILIRLQGLAKLLIRVASTSRKSAIFYLGLIKAGSFYTKGIVFLSTLASIWSGSRDLCKFIVVQYNKLQAFRGSLREKSALKWIEGDYELPKVLEVWLGEDFTNSINNETYDLKMLVKEADIVNYLSNKDTIGRVLSRIQGDEDTSDKTETETRHIEVLHEEKNLEFELDDLIPIPRTAKKIAVAATTQDHTMKSLTSKDSIKNFLKNESYYRKVDRQKSLTISKMKKKIWKTFQDDIKNKLVLMHDSALLDYVNDYLEEHGIKD